MNLSQAKPTPKQLNLNKLGDAGGSKFNGYPMRAEPIFGGTASKVAGPDSNWVTAGDPGCCLDGFPAPVCAKEMVTLQMSAAKVAIAFMKSLSSQIVPSGAQDATTSPKPRRLGKQIMAD